MKTVWVILAAIFFFVVQIVPFEATEWGIGYLNAHPSGIKLLPLIFGLVASFVFTCTISPLRNANYGLSVASTDGKSALNPFWLWLILCVGITLAINLMLE